MTTYSWSYAPTNRAACKGKCKEKIEKGAMRFCTASEDGAGHTMQQYRCLDCVTDVQVKNVVAKLGSLGDMEGFDGLTAADKAKVLAKEGGEAAPKAKAKGKAKAAAAKPEPKAKPKAKAAAGGRAPPPAVQHAFCDKAKAYDFDKIKEMLEEWPLLLNCQPAGRWSALHQFAASGNAEAVTYLLEKGADKNVQTADGKTPAEVAHDDVAELFVEVEEEAEAEDEPMEEPAPALGKRAAPVVAAAVAAPAGAKRGAPEPKAPELAAEAAAPAAAGAKRGAPEPKAAPAAASSSSSGARAPAAAADEEPPAKKAKPAAPAGRAVDASVPDRGSFSVVDEWSVLLNQTNVVANNNKYYKIQVLKKTTGDYCCWTHWGRVGTDGQNQLQALSQAGAEAAFKSKFKQKSGVNYDLLHTHDWTPVIGKYTYVETDEGDGEGGGGGDGAPLGKLTPQQIEKGQAVLSKIADVLGRGGKLDTKKCQDFSSMFYTLVPHDFGFTVPPAITTKDMLEAEEELLKFYLRMGFEEIDQADDGLTPVAGIMDLDLPPTLEAGCAKLCSAKDLKASTEKGKTHAAKQSGKPTSKMEASLYAAIMLYTSNAIYRELNNVLRSEDRTKIKKYFMYLRMLLEALGRLPQQERTLWRGVGVDLIEQYKVGSTITWWGVSSCTADIQVAKNFMNGCGGKCTLLTVETKTAADISEITFFGNEKESLLAPGTQFKVVSASKEGRITNIKLQEVGRALK